MEPVKAGSAHELSPHEKVVVALDASRGSLAALRAAVELASMLDVELEGLFVEDVDLSKLCQYPFQREVGSYTGAVRRLDDRSLHRQLRAVTEYVRKSLEAEARQRTVRWTFQVRRGTVADELLSASQSASVMSIGRAGRRRRDLGATARAVLSQSMRPVLILGEASSLSLPISVVCAQGEDSERALQFAARLQRNRRGALRVLRPSTQRSQADAELMQLINETATNSGVDIIVETLGTAELRSIAAMEAGTLILPRMYAHLLSVRDGASIVIP